MSLTFETTIGGRLLSIETGKVALQANGAVTVRYGNSMVLVTACASKEVRKDNEFVPLTVDYEERLYAAGKIPGSFIRRESRPSEEATLASRLIDRPIRPLFPKSWRNDTQIVITVLSADQENAPDILGIIGASASLTISDIPFNGPLSAVRIGYLNGNPILNPTLTQLTDSLLDLVVVSTKDAVVMIEAEAKEVSESLVLEAIQTGHKANQEIISLQKRLRQTCGKPKKIVGPLEINPELLAALLPLIEDKLLLALSETEKPKRDIGIALLQQQVIENLKNTFPEVEIATAFETRLKSAVRRIILQKKQHLDGRLPEELRSIHGEVGLLPRTHGSGLFTRGQTQVLTITTLGSLRQEQLLDGLGLEESKRFMHHYNFPPFSTGEV